MKKLSMLILLFACILIVLGVSSSEEDVYVVDFNTYPSLEKIEIPVTETRLKLSFVGDIIFHDWVLEAGKNDSDYDFKEIFLDIKPEFDNRDFVFANLETTFAGESRGYSGANYIFNSPDQAVTDLKWVGLNILNTSNNHSLDKGKDGLIRTNNVLSEHDIFHFGTYNTLEESNKSIIIDSKGIRVGFISYSYGTNGWPIPKDMPYCIKLIDKDSIMKDIDSLKNENPDFIIASMHWGNEYKNMYSKVQDELAHFLSDQGVDIIVGTHPHVLQPIEVMEREDGSKTLVIYSLGNFISGQRTKPRDYGGIVNIELVKNDNRRYFDNVDFKATWVQARYKNSKRFMRIVNVSKSLNDYHNEIDTFFTVKEINRMKRIIEDVPSIIFRDKPYVIEADRYIIYKDESEEK